MDQELKQRLIGAAVITALAAIFVPMLFDDPIDETGKSINELKIPELPAKVQDVEIMPLPEKVEDVATEAAPEQPFKANAPAFVDEGEEAAPPAQPTRPPVKLSAKETAITARQAQIAAPEFDVADDAVGEDEDPRAIVKPVKTTPPAAPTTATIPVAKTVKPVEKAAELKAAPTPLETTGKPAAVDAATTRWYLNAGSFSQKANALTLQDSLKQQGFAASIKEIAGDKGTVFKVRVGPMLDKAKAQAVKAKLAQLNINSFVSGDE